VHETTSCTSVGFSVGSVGLSVGFMLSSAPPRHSYTLPPVAAHVAWHRSTPICPHATAYQDAVVENEVGLEVVLINEDSLLTSLEAETATHLQQERLQVVQDVRLQLGFCIDFLPNLVIADCQISFD